MRMRLSSWLLARAEFPLPSSHSGSWPIWAASANEQARGHIMRAGVPPKDPCEIPDPVATRDQGLRS
jgi:hypothetical protein